LDFLNKVRQVFINKNFGLALEFLTSIMIVRYLGISDYGHYTTLYLIPILIASVGSFGYGPSIVYFIGRGNVDVRQYLFSFTLLGMTIGFLFYGLFHFFANDLNTYFYNNRLDVNLFFISLLFIPVVITQKYLRAILRGMYEVKVYSFLLDFLIPVLRLLITITVIFLGFGFIGVVITPIIVQTIVTLIILIYLYTKTENKNQSLVINSPHFVEMSKFGFKSFLGTFLQKSNTSLITIIASSLLSFSQISVLSIAQKLLGMTTSVSNSLLTVLMPKVSKSSISEISEFIPKATSILFTINTVFLLSYLMIVDQMVLILYGVGFDEVRALSIPLGIAAIFLPLCNILLLSITFTGDPIKKSYARGAGFAVNLLSLFYLYNLYGLLGLGISIALGQIVIFILSLIFFRMKFKDVTLRNLFILKIDNLRELKNALSNVFDKKK
tara:strand:+ start:4505 stop:5824 length:1320 start_codon:yes stop_codon:yes gene_type:complete